MNEFPSAAPDRFVRLLWYLALAAVIVGSVVSATSPVMRLIDSTHINDKVEHFTAYAVLAGLPALRAFKCRRLALMMIALFVLGGALELAQLFSPGRSCDWQDLLADTCGILGGAALVRIAQMARRTTA